MLRTNLLYASVAIATLLMVGTQAADAQKPAPGGSTYRPKSPTLSPYLQLFRQDPGQILPSYQNFVQPRVEAREFRRQQEGNVQNLQRGLTHMQHSQKLENTSGTIQSGIGSGFRTGNQHFRSHAGYFSSHRTQTGGGAALVGTQRRMTLAPRRTGLRSSGLAARAIRGR